MKYNAQCFEGLDQDFSDLSGDRASTSSELSAVQEHDARINDRCIAKPEIYGPQR